MSLLGLPLRFLQAQPDHRLLALSREGHEAAFEALVRRYRRELVAYCRRLQPHSGAAEDTVQQTLLQAWRALAAGAEVRDARPWLYRIAHNVTLNQLRGAAPIPLVIPDTVDGPDVPQLVEQRLQARAALDGLASLPALQRRALVSTTLDGASHAEVASALGISSGAVRGLVYRARVALRSAAAVITPNPVLHWTLRHIDTPGRSPAVAELAAGGGGATVAAVLAKGGAVLTLAVAGTSGALLARGSDHRHPSAARSARASAHRSTAGRATNSALREVVLRGRDLEGYRVTNEGEPGPRSSASRRGDSRDGHDGGRRSGASGETTTGGDDGSSGGADRGSSPGSSGSSDGGSRSGTTTTSGPGLDGDSGSRGTGPETGSQTSAVATTSSSGGDGGTSGGPGPSSGSVSGSSSGSGSGSDSSSGSDSGSGSGDTVTTSPP